MKNLVCLILLALLIGGSVRHAYAGTGDSFVAANDVTWTTPGKDENDSMPIGNGDLAANVWTESNGDLILLLAKSDAWSEQGKILKLGRIRIGLMPNPFAGATDFTQTLKLETGRIEIKAGDNTMQIWVDANHPVMHIEAHLQTPAAMTAKAEFWRKTETSSTTSGDSENARVMKGEASPRPASDTLFSSGSTGLCWCHFNPDSVYPYVLRQEHLESVLPSHQDPLLHRCFGVMVNGSQLTAGDDQTLKSASPAKDLGVNIIALTQAAADSPIAWQKQIETLAQGIDQINLDQARSAHQQWWQDFWDRSWIHVAGTEDAAKVSQGYIMQRYMMACSSRGEIPTKFNGGLFTVGHDLKSAGKQTATDHDPDFRQWGESYWNQNNRLLYWPLIATGDRDLLQPWFDMYLKALPLATDRARIYYHHAGAYLPETMLFWGVPRLEDFGRDNPSNEIESRWQRFHIQGSLEVICQMLDVFDQDGDARFAKQSMVPFADAIITFYDQHYPRDSVGKLTMVPAQSLETYQLVAVNPTPDLAGLMSVLPRLIALPTDLTSEKQRSSWAKLLGDLPPIPIGKTAHKKIPPLGVGDPDGTPEILPAEQYGKTGNSENPELYVAFPYRLFGVGKPNLQLAQDTFAARRSPQDTCWGQDGTQASILGLTSVAQQAAIAEFTDYGNQRFLWFWKPGHDWIPDLDNGGDGMITLQNMLMQCDGKRIQLLPAWPADWTADFKLHAPLQTTVEGHIEAGKITAMKVTPESRAGDVVVVTNSQKQP